MIHLGASISSLEFALAPFFSTPLVFHRLQRSSRTAALLGFPLTAAQTRLIGDFREITARICQSRSDFNIKRYILCSN